MFPYLFPLASPSLPLSLSHPSRWSQSIKYFLTAGSSSFFFLINLFIYLFLAVLGLRFCVRAFSSCGERGPLFIAVRGPLTIAASLVAEHRLQMRRLSSCGSRAQLLRGMWDLPRPGLEPVSPALAGRFSTTAPPGKPHPHLLNTSLYFSELFPRVTSTLRIRLALCISSFYLAVPELYPL